MESVIGHENGLNQFHSIDRVRNDLESEFVLWKGHIVQIFNIASAGLIGDIYVPRSSQI